MNLPDVLSKIKSSFIKRKPIDFPEYNLHVEIESLTATDEIKILEACKTVEGAQYIDFLKRYTLALSIKKIDDIEIGDTIEYIDEKGEKKSTTKFLYMSDQISKWPDSLIGIIFEAYSELNNEVEDRVRKGAKFEVMKLSEKIAPEKPSKFRQVNESDTEEGLSDVEKLNKVIAKEQTNASTYMEQVKDEAVEKFKR